MHCTAAHLRLYAVTDRRYLQGCTLTQAVEQAILGGVTMVQLREKDLPYQEFLAQAKELVALCRPYGVPLLINDNVDIALASGADGVHLGQTDMCVAQAREHLGPEAIIGVTAPTLAQALAAQDAGAQYLGAGAVFATGTKADAKPLDHRVLRQITQAVNIPVCAIGGITPENLPQLSTTGIAGVALASTIFAQTDIVGTCKTLSTLVRGIVDKQEEFQ